MCVSRSVCYVCVGVGGQVLDHAGLSFLVVSMCVHCEDMCICESGLGYLIDHSVGYWHTYEGLASVFVWVTMSVCQVCVCPVVL